MKRVVSWAAVAVSSLGLLAGCRPAVEKNETGQTEARVAQALEAGAVVLDRAASGAVLLGQPRAVPADTDGARLLRLRWLDGRGAEVRVEGAAEVVDAHFFADGAAIVAVREGGELVTLAANGTTARVLDHDAHGPLSVSGNAVAYARGRAPELEIARADLLSGGARELTTGQAPCWSPALSDDGRAVLYVSAATGFPELYVVREGSPARKLTSRVEGEAVPFPTSPRAPRWRGDEHRGTLSFADETGEKTLELRALRANVGASR